MNGLTWINPRQISFCRNEEGWLSAKWNGREGTIIAGRLFPVTLPGGMVRVTGVHGEEWGLIRAVSDLDADSRLALESEIRLNPYLPEIRSIVSLRRRDRSFEWETMTDFGPLRFETLSLYEAVCEREDGLRVITDISGQLYVLPAGMLLDRQSRKRLSKWI